MFVNCLKRHKRYHILNYIMVYKMASCSKNFISFRSYSIIICRVMQVNIKLSLRYLRVCRIFHMCYCFLFLDVTYGRHHRRDANRLDILPAGPQTFPIGKNSFFTCRAHVHNPGLVKNLKWLGPNGMPIPQDDRYVAT